MSESTPDTETKNNEPERDNPGEGNPTTAKASEGQTAPTQQQSGDGADVGEVTDEMLPEDLQPTDDNPLAKPPSDDDEDKGMSLGPDGPQA